MPVVARHLKHRQLPLWDQLHQRPVVKGKHMKSVLKLGMLALLTVSGLGLAACDSTKENAVESKADAVREASDAAADHMEDKADTMSGSAEDSMNSKAEAVRERGDAKADAMENKADKMDKKPE